MTTDTPIRAWHNSPDLKAEVVARLHAHRAADEITQGFYQMPAPGSANGYRGCALGCTLPLVDADTRCEYDFYPSGPMWWGRIEAEYGIPVGVAELIDHTFEAQDTVNAGPFAVEVIEAIPVGAHLAGIADRWYDAQMYDAEPAARARWLIEHLAAAPVPQVTP